MLLIVVVHAASTQDRDGVKYVFWLLRQQFTERLVKVIADGGYAGQLVEWVATFCKFVLEIVRRPEEAKGFVVVRKRWIVERTLSWLGKFRRLSKDYEFSPQSSESMVYLAMINVMLRRLRPGKPA